MDLGDLANAYDLANNGGGGYDRHGFGTNHKRNGSIFKDGIPGLLFGWGLDREVKRLEKEQRG